METIKNLSVGIEEQETHISYMRDESYAKVYTSDSTQMTRLDKLCKTNLICINLLKIQVVGKVI